MLMDEQFLNVLHSIEEITNATPLREAAKQLPTQIYNIIQSQEQLTRIPAELTDQLYLMLQKHITIQLLSPCVSSLKVFSRDREQH